MALVCAIAICESEEAFVWGGAEMPDDVSLEGPFARLVGELLDRNDTVDGSRGEVALAPCAASVSRASVDDLRVIYRFFDCLPMRPYYAGLLAELRLELAARGVAPD